MAINDPQDPAWHLDTGAMDHITNNSGNLYSLVPYQGTNSVMVGNGETLPITHIGIATIGSSPSPIQLYNILLVPSIKKDVLLVSKLTYDYPLTFEFMAPSFVIKDRVTDRIRAKPRNHKGLYTFDI